MGVLQRAGTTGPLGKGTRAQTKASLASTKYPFGPDLGGQGLVSASMPMLVDGGCVGPSRVSSGAPVGKGAVVNW